MRNRPVALGETTLDFCDGCIEPGNPARVVVGGDAALGNVDGLARLACGETNHVTERLWAIFKSCSGQLRARWRWNDSFRVEPESGVGLHADKIARVHRIPWRGTSAPRPEDSPAHSGHSHLRLANATCYLDALGHVVVAWLWLDQAACAARALNERDEAFYRGKLAACRYFFRWELPRIDRWLALLDPVDRTPLDAADEWFG